MCDVINNDLDPTDFTTDAFMAFYEGRSLIHNAEGELTQEQLIELGTYRDVAVAAWEGALAATAVHYINDTIQDTLKIDNDPSNYDFAKHAKHWSEMKGFALSMQFNRNSPMNAADFKTMHDLMGLGPALEDDSATDRTAYIDDLLEARALLQSAYSFDADNMGDDDGQDGW